MHGLLCPVSFHDIPCLLASSWLHPSSFSPLSLPRPAPSSSCMLSLSSIALLIDPQPHQQPHCLLISLGLSRCGMSFTLQLSLLTSELRSHVIASMKKKGREEERRGEKRREEKRSRDPPVPQRKGERGRCSCIKQRHHRFVVRFHFTSKGTRRVGVMMQPHEMTNV